MSSSLPPLKKGSCSPSAKSLKKIKKLLSSVEIIKEDLFNEQNLSPIKPEEISRKTHKIIKSNGSFQLDLNSMTSINEDIMTTNTYEGPKERRFHSIESKKSSDITTLNEENNYFRRKNSFSDQLSLQSELSELQFGDDELFSYNAFSVEELENVEDLVQKQEKNAKIIQKTWKMARIRKNYLKLLRKFKLAEILIVASNLAMKQKEMGSCAHCKNLEEYKRKLETYQEKILHRIREGRIVGRDDKKQKKTLQMRKFLI